MRSFLTGLAFAALAAVATPSLSKADVFDFSFTGAGGPSGTVLGSGTFTTDPSQGNNTFLVTGVTGSVTMNAMGPFVISGVSGYAGADNILTFPGQTFVSFAGLSFSTLGGGDFNLFSNGGYFALSSNVDATGFPENGSPITFDVSPTVAAVPGPIAGAGLFPLFGLAGAWYARRRKQRLAA